MRAGPLRHRGTIQRATNTATADGGFTPTWAAIGDVYMQVAPISGREFLEADQMRADVTHKITMRWHPDLAVTPRDRILWGARVFHIEHLINVQERDRTLVAMVREEV